MMNSTHTVQDRQGGLEIDAAAPWGAQTQRALRCFAIGGPQDAERMPTELLRALVLLKGVCATVNARLQQLPLPLAHAIDKAANALLAAAPEAQQQAPFPLSMWQSAAGTQSHANVNEVLAHLATQGPDAPAAVDPDAHVNLAPSGSGMLACAMHIAVVLALHARLLPPMGTLEVSLAVQASVHDTLSQLGHAPRDAGPPGAGAVVGNWRGRVLMAGHAIGGALPALHALALGGGDSDTGFAAEVCRELEWRTGTPFVPAPEHAAAPAGPGPLVALHAALKLLALDLATIAGQARLRAASPAETEAGEALLMVCWQVIGNDVAVNLGAGGGPLYPGAGLPLIVANVLRSIRLLGDAMAVFEAQVVHGLAPDARQLGHGVAESVRGVTALAPHIGLEQATRIAQRAHAQGCTLREAALALGLEGADFDRWVDPAAALDPPAAA